MFYKQRPYIYIVIGTGSIVFANGSKLGIGSGILLSACGAMIFIMRKEYREKNSELDTMHSQLTKAQESKEKAASKIRI